MKYEKYSDRDLANDSFFIRWVKHPDDESDWFWQSFIEEHPQCRSNVEKAKELIRLLDFPADELSQEEFSGMRNNLLMRLRAEREKSRDMRPLHTAENETTVWRWAKLAAAVIIVPLVAVGVFLKVAGPEANILSLVKRGESAVEKRVNPIGQKSVLFLSDGTKVWLNAASKITYVKAFSGRDTRDVYLEGEAFFDVAHDESKPFIVHTSSIKIKVLGTSFNVKSYADEKTIETTLLEGKVRIEQSDATGNRIGDVELKPNQRAVFNKKSKVINIKEVVADNSVSWKQDRMVFDGESIDNVLLQLERWFDVEIHVQNKGNLECKLTASIENESLEEVLKLIEASHDVHYRIVGNEVFIEGRLCDSQRDP